MKEKLVVVGNGMAGIRTVEELLKLTPEQYAITVFGAEPLPNYNRILLSPVVFGVILGTGVGGGIVVNGRLLEGAQHIAGEWGHNVLEADGPPCYCGKRGCVETFLSGPGLARDFAAQGGATLDARAIATAAGQGDVLADAAMQRYLDRFGRALSVVVNILDPDAIVLGGGMSNIARLYTEGRDYVARHTFNDELRTRILPNRHGDSSGVRGAAQLWPV